MKFLCQPPLIGTQVVIHREFENKEIPEMLTLTMRFRLAIIRADASCLSHVTIGNRDGL